MRDLFQSRRRGSSAASAGGGIPNSTMAVPAPGSSYAHHQADSNRSRQQNQGHLHPQTLRSNRPSRSGRNHQGASSGRRNTTDNRSVQSNSRQRSTANMTDHRSVASSPTVPTYIPEAAATITTGGSTARLSDDEWSWVSGMSNHGGRGGGRSVGGNSHYSYSSANYNNHNSNNPFWRDGKAIKRVLDDLSRAEDGETCRTVLSVICVEFDHNDTIRHNAELYYGAVAVLTKHLSMTDHHEEIRMICAAMEMSFRGGTKFVKEAFHMNGADMIPLLLRLLDRCEQSRIRYADEIILNISKVFHYLSRISDLRVTVARQQGLLDCLGRVASTPLNVASRNVRVRIIANLANCDDNKILMFVHPGLLASLLKIAQLDLSDDTRQYAATTIMDLASAPANQIPMAKNSQFLRGLTKMTVADGDATIRECAVTTLQNLAFPKNNRKRLVEFQEGFVLEALLGVVLNERNVKTRRRAGGALTNLVYLDTVERMARQPELLSTLAAVSVNDESLEVQSRACLALTKIATSVDVNSTSWNDLLSALVVASDTKAKNNISAVLRCKAREIENRESLARHPKILKILAEICCNQSASLKDRDNATRALMHLANENANRKIMCSEKILDALVRGASTFPDAEDKSNDNLIMKEIHDSAIRAIARLATEFSNRPVMAMHKGLLVTLAKATERECKSQDRGVSSDGQQPSLGKPLLMSLLMAM